MSKLVRLAIAGVGNNISALVQGVYFYRHLLRQYGDEAELPGIRHVRIGGMNVSDVAVVAAFDVQAQKVGQDLATAIFQAPNNYPRLNIEVPQQKVSVTLGLRLDESGVVVGQEQVVAELRRSKSDALLYSLPTGMQWAADAYAQCCLEAGVGFVNCTPEVVAGNPKFLAAFEAANIPLIGDDLASHLGSSIVHRTILRLLSDRGLTLRSSYQLNIGGNEDFRNLRENGGSKLRSKKNALAQNGDDLGRIEVIPSAGYISHLKDNKVAMLNMEAEGWGGTPVSLDLKLKVQDSSNAAGVIIDLIRIASAAQQRGLGGFHPAASPLLKSPPFGHAPDEIQAAEAALLSLDEPVEVFCRSSKVELQPPKNTKQLRRVAIIAYDDVEELDLVGVLAPLAKAGAELAIEIMGPASFRGSSGLQMAPDRTFTSAYDFSTLVAVVLPGGKGAASATQDPALSDFLRRARSAGVRFYAVCSGVLILRDLELLDGLLVASHHKKRHLLGTSGCNLGAGVLRDQWLVSAGGFSPGDGPKGVEIAFQILRDIAPDLVVPVADQMELWPMTSAQSAPTEHGL